MIDKTEALCMIEDALLPFKTLGVPAFVAGGAIRDLWMGIEPRDIDIFVFGPQTGKPGWTQPMKHLEQLKEMLEENGHDCADLNPDFFYPIEEGGTEVVGVIEFSNKVANRTVQVIMVDGYNQDTILERFDYGICRAMTDGSTVFYHPDFLEDLTDRVFRLRRERVDMSLASSVERYARFKQRAEFEDWKFAPFGGVFDPNKETFADAGTFHSTWDSPFRATKPRHGYTPVSSAEVRAHLTRPLASLPGLS